MISIAICNQCFHFIILNAFQMMMSGMGNSRVLIFSLLVLATFQQVVSDEHQPLSKVAIHKTTLALDERAFIKATPNVLGLKVRFDCAFENFLLFSRCFVIWL